jgi:hypothetical protein
MLNDASQTLFFSENLKDSVESLLHEASPADLFKCKVYLDHSEIVCNLLSVDTCTWKILIKAELRSDDALLMINNLNAIRGIEIEHDNNLLSSHDIERIKLSKKKSPDLFGLKIKLLKS